MKNLNKIILLLLITAFWNCEDFDDDVDDVTITSGTADFSNYVAIGNSLTAGFADNALYTSGQENSYPNILATQMLAAGGGTFNQPLMQDDIGGFTDIMDANGNLAFPGRLVLELESFPSPQATAPQSSFDNISANAPFDNLGIPGARSYDLSTPGYAQFNAYYGRMVSNPSQTVIADAVGQTPTFFTYWAGNNDVLGYSTSGGVSNDSNCIPSATNPCVGAITNTAVFEATLTAQLQALTANGAGGAIANIPSVTSIPFFNTVPYNALDADTNAAYAAQIPALNATFAGLNQVFSALGADDRSVTFNTTGTSPLLIHDENLTDLSAQITAILSMSADPSIAALAPIFGQQFGQSRQATESELVLLTASSLIGTVNQERFTELTMAGVPAETAGQLSANGLTYPMQDQYILLDSEVQDVQSAVTSYNSIIANLADTFDLALVDANAELVNLESGLTFDGVDYSVDFVTGGAFSLDGVHPTPKGYAIIANLFIDAINAKYGSNLWQVNPNVYPGVNFP